jgi:hypothetical protein
MRQSSASPRPSRCRSEHPDGRRLGRARPDGNQQSIKLRHEERRARAGHGRDARGPPIGRPLRFENIKKAGPATHVDAATFRIDEQIIGVATGLGSRDELAASHGEDAKLSRGPEDHQNLASPWIQGHREVGTVIGNGHLPVCLCEARSTTAIPCASGTLTKTCPVS